MASGSIGWAAARGVSARLADIAALDAFAREVIVANDVTRREATASIGTDVDSLAQWSALWARARRRPRRLP